MATNVRRAGLLLATLTLAACSTVQDHLDQARNLTFQKKYREAVAQYAKVVAELGHDESPRARDQRASALRGAADLCYLELSDYVKAAQLYRDLAERYPDRPETFDARANLADILRDHFQDRRGALAQLAALVQSFPNHLDTDRYQYRAAEDYFALRDYAQTETELKLFLARYPGSAFRTDAQMLLASALAFQGRRAEAVAAYQALAREHGGAAAARAYVEVARLDEDSGDFEQAETFLALALKDHPNPAMVRSSIDRIRRRVALRRPVDIHDHAAIFDHVQRSVAVNEGD